MIASFFGPNCAAPLDYDGAQPILRCACRGSTVALDQPPAQFRAGRRVRATILYREITGAGLDVARRALDRSPQALDRFAAGEALCPPSQRGGVR